MDSEGYNHNDAVRVVSENGTPIAECSYACCMLTPENAKFIAMAGTVAHKLDSLGYDGEKAIEMLPEILKQLRFLKGEVEYSNREAIQSTEFLIDSIKP